MPDNVLVIALLVCVSMLVAAAPATRPIGGEGDNTDRQPNADKAMIKPQRAPDKQIVFKTAPRGDLKLHTYFPPDWKASDKRPAIVLFFGGGWKNANNDQFLPQADYFASRGLVGIAADYRVSNTRKPPPTGPDTCVQDARSAIRYVRQHAAELGVDPDRIIAGGGSSGGHLAACTALCPGPDDSADDVRISCRPQALVLWNPVVDAFDATPAKYMALLLPGSSEEQQKMMHVISPIEHLDDAGVSCPPTIVFFGSADQLKRQGERFIEQAQAKGARIELWTAPDQRHGFFNAPGWNQSTTQKADEFLASLGYLQGPPTIKVPEGPFKLDATTASPKPGR